MNLVFQKIGAVIVGVAMTVGGLLGYAPEKNVGGSTASSDVIALFTTTLASRITDSATSLTLTSATDKDGNALASSTYGMIIDEGTATEELVLADCTGTTCTNVTRGLSVRTGTTTVSALKFEHRRGAEVKITDAPSLIFATNVFRGRQNVDKLMNYDSDLSIASTSRAIPYASWVIGQTNTASSSAFRTVLDQANTYLSTSTFNNGLTLGYSIDSGSDALDVANKSYVDAVAVAGASDSNETTKGIVEEATVAEINSKSATGGTGAKLFMTPTKFAVSRFASSTQYFATSTTSGVDLFILSVPMLAGDVMKVWSSNAVNCNSHTENLVVRPTNYTASTTIFTGKCNSNNTINSVSMIGSWTATTTSSVHVGLDTNGDASEWTSLMVEVTGHP